MTFTDLHQVHVKTSGEHPYGPYNTVIVDGEVFPCTGLKIEFSAEDLNTVTLTFPARVTMEEDQ